MTLSYRCPECGRVQRFSDDEWPDPCCVELEETRKEEDDAATICPDRA